MKRIPTQTRQRNRRCSKTNRTGATIVEFAIVAPIFFVLLLAGIEFATLGTIRSTAHNAAYEGARKLVIPGANPNDGIDEATRILGIVGVDKLTVTTDPTTIDDTTQEITLNISIPYDDNAVFVPYFTGGITITSSVTLKTERYGGITVTP